jgi:hypothetical protein
MADGKSHEWGDALPFSASHSHGISASMIRRSIRVGGWCPGPEPGCPLLRPRAGSELCGSHCSQPRPQPHPLSAAKYTKVETIGANKIVGCDNSATTDERFADSMQLRLRALPPNNSAPRVRGLFNCPSIQSSAHAVAPVPFYRWPERLGPRLGSDKSTEVL